MRILLVEDNLAEGRFMREILQEKLARRLILRHVQRLAEAFGTLADQTFDVVLLDLTLPDSQGLASVDRLLADYPQLPIVVLTNMNDDALAVAAVRHGAQDYLMKRQVNADVLVRSISYAIERQQAADALQAANENLEQRVAERTAELAAANQQLKQEILERQQLEAQFLRAQRLESLGTLSAGIAHDMNNILTPILAVSQLLPLKLPQLDANMLRLLQVMEDSAHRGAALVKQILAFARGVEGNRTTVKVDELLTEVTQILQQTLPKTIQIAVDCRDDLEPVYGDVTQLHQVLMNLSVNARDAMPHGGKLQITAEMQTLDSTTAQMHIEAKPGLYIVIGVKDTGMGMSPEVLDRIFDPFFTTKAMGQGTGLGLSAVLGIVNSHGGFIDAQSEVVRGTSFRLFLPAYQVAAGVIEHDDDFPPGHQEVVLVVDDEAAVRESTKATLESYNYFVLVAASGTEAVNLCQRYPDRIDFMLIDLMMPELDGFDTLAQLQHWRSDTPAIAMSGVNSAGLAQRTEVSGFARFLGKPFTTQMLLQALEEQRKLLRQRELNDAVAASPAATHPAVAVAKAAWAAKNVQKTTDQMYH
ncbi:response regulator [filamentous cyanobacterium LEGE 11480]|uniref:histidine kinase n=1 Tax=Romeriopsis navalis LEGE 11480 TaxID=2777977 RepID=A0A928VJM8_9CYAN|nr:response regulator [Romeriopsis navalis LEGE 11480]